MDKPRVVAFIGNSELGRHALELVKDSLVEIVTDDAAGEAMRLVDWLNPEAATAEALAELKPTHGICAGYRSIIPQGIIDLFPGGIMNVHTSLLPYGRGAHPNAWAIAEGHPAGVTCHLVDAGVDTGPIVSQVTVDKFGHDTAATLQARLIEAALRLMASTWPRFVAGEIIPSPQPETKCETHQKRDLDRLILYDGSTMRVRDVIDMIRARTFAPWPGIVYETNDRKWYRLRLEIEPIAVAEH